MHTAAVQVAHSCCCCTACCCTGPAPPRAPLPSCCKRPLPVQLQHCAAHGHEGGEDEDKSEPHAAGGLRSRGGGEGGGGQGAWLGLMVCVALSPARLVSSRGRARRREPPRTLYKRCPPRLPKPTCCTNANCQPIAAAQDTIQLMPVALAKRACLVPDWEKQGGCTDGRHHHPCSRAAARAPLEMGRRRASRAHRRSTLPPQPPAPPQPPVFASTPRPRNRRGSLSALLHSP